MRHKSNNKTRPLFTLSLEMTRLVNETRLLLVPCFNSDIYGNIIPLNKISVSYNYVRIVYVLCTMIINVPLAASGYLASKFLV